MALNAKPLPRRRTLPGLLAAVEQQPRLWLPLQLQADQFWVWSVPFVAVMLVASLWSLLADLLGAGPVGSVVALVLMAIGAAGATWGAMRTQRRPQRAGWEVSFEHRTLTPVGLPGRDTITLGPEFSLGCCPAADGRDDRAWQLELRHIRKGPVAELTFIHVGAGSPEDLELLDRFMNRLAERLQVRRSGAPLPGVPRPATPRGGA